MAQKAVQVGIISEDKMRLVAKGGDYLNTIMMPKLNEARKHFYDILIDIFYKDIVLIIAGYYGFYFEDECQPSLLFGRLDGDAVLKSFSSIWNENNVDFVAVGCGYGSRIKNAMENKVLLDNKCVFLHDSVFGKGTLVINENYRKKRGTDIVHICETFNLMQIGGGIIVFEGNTLLKSRENLQGLNELPISSSMNQSSFRFANMKRVKWIFVVGVRIVIVQFDDY